MSKKPDWFKLGLFALFVPGIIFTALGVIGITAGDYRMTFLPAGLTGLIGFTTLVVLFRRHL